MTRPFGYGREPAGWRRTQLRSFLTRRRRSGRTDLPLLSVNLPHGVVPRFEGDGRPAPSEDLSNYQLVEKGDLVMNQLGKPHGALGVSQYVGIISPAYFVATIGSDAEPRFVHHLLRTRLYISEYERRGKFMPPSQFDISWEDFRSIPAVIPPIATQRAIADYLDWETARIDALIDAKRRTIELLEERFRSEVSSLVAEGPRCQLRRVTSFRTSGPRGWADRVGDHGQPFIRSANLRRDDIDLRPDNQVLVDPSPGEEAARSRTRTGDVLIGITGANTGWVGQVGQSDAGGFVSQHVAMLRPAGILSRWLAYTLFSHQVQDQLRGGQYGGTKQQLGLEDLAELWINCPSLTRQSDLVATLDRSKAISGATAQALASQTDLLAEHRLVFITAAVSGEIEIPVAAS